MKSVQSMKKHNPRKLKLIDAETNMEYEIQVNEEDFNRAFKDLRFANALLQTVKFPQTSTFSKKHSSSTIEEPSCSGTSAKNINLMISDDSDIEINETNNDVSDIENDTNVSNIDSNDKWTHNATLLLILSYKENSHMLGKGPHKKMWNIISQRMKEKQLNFTATQCYNKMDTLKRRYRQITDHNAQSGNDRKEWIYLEPLDEIFFDKPWIKPISVAGSNIREPESLFDDSDSDPTNKKKKMSLHEEKISYLRTSLEEKRLRREETRTYRAEKLKILKDLKNIFQTKK
ncbi:uncharacterized protein [Temnothorax longispinosus]|uniref:uncharacterized protein n=1 Tax=Temnothorax longispinosus TaxID=300112 RepID=UPI003A99B658